MDFEGRWGMNRVRASGLRGIVGLAALLGTGCAAIQWDTSWAPKRPLGAEYETFRPVRLPEPGQAEIPFEEPTGNLRLREALGYALLRSPRLAAFSWEVRAHEARTLQAALPPNPEFGFRSEDIFGTGPFNGLNYAETTLQLGQLVELGGKRSKRHRVADLDEDVAGWDYETERIEVLTDTTRLFTGALVAQQQLALAGELVRIARESLEVVNTEVAEGLASPIERTRAHVTLAAAEVDRTRLEAELDTSYSDLAAAWGSEQERFDELEGALENVVEPPPLQELVARVEQNPHLARWATEIEQRKAVVELERAQRIPDVFLAAGVRRLSTVNETTMVFGFEVPIPLIDRNQGNVLAARYELARAETRHRATRLAILTTLASADDRLGGAYAEVTALRSGVLPEAEQVFQMMLEEFDAGRYPYDDVLDAQRTLFRLRSQYLEALRDYHLAVADVERLIGEPLHP
jgi:cobalt-zinc-cadmium efflux system outer membrane protein